MHICEKRGLIVDGLSTPLTTQVIAETYCHEYVTTFSDFFYVWTRPSNAEKMIYKETKYYVKMIMFYFTYTEELFSNLLSKY